MTARAERIGAAGGNVVTLFAAAADRRGGAPAILDADGRVLWSFEALARAASRMAGGLAGAGVGPGDRVLVLESDPRRRYAVVAGILWAGGTVLAPPASLAPRAALAAAAVTGPSAVVFGPQLWPAVLGERHLRAVPLRIVTRGPRLPGAATLADLARATAVPPREVAGDLPALGSFTTGSSGPPQLVLRSHDLLRAQHDALSRLRDLTPADRDLAGLPFLSLHDLASGVTCVLGPSGRGGRDGRRVRNGIARAGVTSAAGFPSLFEAAAGDGGSPLAGLRAIHVGGSRVPAELLGSLARAAPAAEVTVVYGSTEAEPIAAIPAGDYLDALAGSDPDEGLCAGRVVPGLELRVVPLAGPDGASRNAPDGTGEILVRGPRAVARPGADGWASTGDAGRLADDRRLWLLGRTANTVAGHHPFQVERAVESMDWVDQAALVRTQTDPDAPGMLVVAPRRWDPGAVTQWGLATRRLASERGWSIDAIRLVPVLPVLPGPAAKIDSVGLARSAATGGRVRAGGR